MYPQRREGWILGIQKGTKLTDNPKNKTFKVRLDETTVEKLEYLAKKHQVTKSDVIRNGIDVQYKQEK